MSKPDESPPYVFHLSEHEYRAFVCLLESQLSFARYHIAEPDSSIAKRQINFAQSMLMRIRKAQNERETARLDAKYGGDW